MNYAYLKEAADVANRLSNSYHSFTLMVISHGIQVTLYVNHCVRKNTVVTWAQLDAKVNPLLTLMGDMAVL